VPECPSANDDIAATVRTIRDRIKDTVINNQWSYLYPSATVDLKIGDSAQSKYIDAPPQLEELFELKRVKGRLLEDVIQKLVNKMPEYQRKAFLQEQNNLIGGLVLSMGAGQGEDFPYATVPIVFEKHDKYEGRAFLPVIVRYQFFRPTNVLRLRVLYLDVTAATTMDNAKHCFICGLRCDTKLKLA